ncbi:Thiol:disulfide interchange protein DsbE [BD1-7 clade bacterium]|uniref:Thiol:disulfide interchange protein DsbE n=1 Tax=BD1-7 clade bacterium TaxID=2029982 RepID=A0A5S9NU47_9GAMM|nr:Thiol:disulfide interchange protein DsbE [BD1-7 clade bacterium]CAA0094134.1 Thiol:disulfide interchange protein DsbE [BD1-7 clade bacterium]
MNRQVEPPKDARQHWSIRWGRELLLIVVFIAVVGTAIDYYRLTQRDNKRLSPAVMEFLTAQLNTPKTQPGQPYLIYTWATWCGVCNLTSRAVSNIAEDYPVITIALRSGDQQTVNQFIEQNNYGFNAIADNDGSLSQAMDVGATPTFFIVNTDGTIRYFSVGVNTEPTLRLKLSLFSQASDAPSP